MLPIGLRIKVENDTIEYGRNFDFRSSISVKRYVNRVQRDLVKKRKRFEKLKKKVGYKFARAKIGYIPKKVRFDLDEKKREILLEYVSKRKSEISDRIFDLYGEETDAHWDERIWGSDPGKREMIENLIEKYGKKEDILRELESALEN